MANALPKLIPAVTALFCADIFVSGLLLVVCRSLLCEARSAM